MTKPQEEATKAEPADEPQASDARDERPEGLSIVQVTADAPMVIPPAIAKALVAVQKVITPLEKTAENPHFKNSYVPLSEVVPAAIRVMSPEGLGFTQWPISDGEKHYLMTTLFHQSGASISGKLELLMAQKTSQGMGSAITYAKRYGLMAILGLVGDEDDDGNKAAGRREPATPEQLAEIKQVAIDLKYPADQIAARLQTIKSSDQAIVALYNLNKQVENKAEQINRVTEAASIPVFSGDAPKPDSVIDAVSSALMKLDRPIEWKRKLVPRVTKKPFMKNCTPEELTLLAEVIEAIKDGTFDEPAEWSEGTDIAPPEPTA